MRAIQEIINRIEYLPPIPHTLYHVLDVMNSPEVSFDEVFKAMQFDPVISADILKLCNSSFFTRRRCISSLREAIKYIGLTELKNSILFLAMKGVFKQDSPGYETHTGELLQHAVAVAMVSRQVEQFAPGCEADLFTTALLHDVGKLILHEYVGHAHDEMAKVIQETKCSFEEAELRTVGITHAQLGAIILEKWNFPPAMVAAVRFHHHPDQVPNSPLTHFVALADVIAMLMGYGTGQDGLAYKAYAGLYGQYGISEHTIEEIILSSSDQIAELLSVMA